MEDRLKRIEALPPEKRALLELKLKKAQQGQAPPAAIRPLDRASVSFPLSFAQQALWVVSQLEPDSVSYSIPLALRLRGTLNPTILEQSFNYLVQRHEVLRTGFRLVDALPMQVIRPHTTLPLAMVDLQAHAEHGREALALEGIRAAIQQPFDLHTDSLIRITLFQLAQSEHILLLNLHHIVSDNWSMGIIIREILAVYDALVDERRVELPALTIQYADYAVWQRSWMQGEVLDKHLSYWTEQLADAPALLNLPLDRPRGAQRGTQGAQVSQTIPSAMVEALTSLGHEQGATLFMVLLAAFSLVLHRGSGQHDIVVGSVVANRSQRQCEALIGCFVNQVALRIQIDREQTVAEFLRQVRQNVLNAYVYENLPLEKVIAAINPPRNESYMPLFQVNMILLNAPAPKIELADISVERIDLHNQTSKFDLTLLVWETAEGVRCMLEYNSNIFAQTTVIALLKHFVHMLDALVASRELRLSELEILRPAVSQADASAKFKQFRSSRRNAAATAQSDVATAASTNQAEAHKEL